jgi:hypothetical protein
VDTIRTVLFPGNVLARLLQTFVPDGTFGSVELIIIDDGIFQVFRLKVFEIISFFDLSLSVMILLKLFHV